MASLAVRAGSEAAIRHGHVPDNVEVITRQKLNSILRERGLWATIEPSENELLGSADGEWPADAIEEAPTWSEQNRVLRWVLRLDEELMPLAHFPRVDYGLARDFLERRVIAAGRWRSLREICDVRDSAWRFVARAVAELHKRHLISLDDESKKWASDFLGQVEGPSRDFLVGTKTVGELDEKDLRLVGEIALARARYAAYLAGLQEMIEPVGFDEWCRTHLGVQAQDEE